MARFEIITEINKELDNLSYGELLDILKELSQA